MHFSNNPLSALKFAKQVIVASIHARAIHRDILEKGGAEKVVTLDQICSAPVRGGAGYNPDYGVLGSNYTNDESVKLFPRGCGEFVRELQAEMKSRTGRDVEVLVYGDGAFKDPVCGIWELADPVVSPGFTDGLVGLPKEIKFKYVADNAEGKDPAKAVEDAIRAKGDLDRFGHSTLGTTPRRLTDLIGSLCDLTSGSGDKGTPVVYIQATSTATSMTELDNVLPYSGIDPRGRVKFSVLLEMFQQMADADASKFGLSVYQTLEHNITWVLRKYRIELESYPTAESGNIRIKTYAEPYRNLFSLRSFKLWDSHGKFLGSAYTWWVLLDFAKQRPMRLDKCELMKASRSAYPRNCRPT